MALTLGSILRNRYRIDEAIAIGGMGAVYRATDETLGIRVAVKENFFSTDEASRQFRREATILAGLRHDNLPRVTDHFVMPGQGQYLVMDFIEGSDLRNLIGSGGALPHEDIVRIGIVICDALQYLHTRTPPIVHRDIKPGNIKVTPKGEVYLVDFGLAKQAHGEATTTGAQGLTPGYAPPEQYGQGTEARSDVYSLGATLYAALTGKVPEDGLSRAMGSMELTPITKINPKVPDRLARTIERAMAVSPDERFDSAEAFKRALQNAAPKPVEAVPLTVIEQRMIPSAPESVPGSASAGHAPAQRPNTAAREALAPTVVGDHGSPTVIEPAGGRVASAPAKGPSATGPAASAVAAVPPPARSKGRFPTAALLGMGGVLVIAAVVLYSLGFFRPQAVLPAAQTQPATAAPSATAEAISPEPTNTLPPTQTTAPTQPPTHTPEPITSPPQQEASPTTAATLAARSQEEIAFSSDRAGTMQIWIMNLDGSNPRQVTKLTDGACQPDWSPDGSRLVFISPCSKRQEEYPGAGMFLINADGSGLVPLRSVPGGDFDPAWSPDGSAIAFSSLRDGRSHIYLYTLADGSVKRITSDTAYDRQPAWSPDGKQIAFTATRNGRLQIVLKPIDGSDERDFKIPEGSIETWPAWSPDDSLLVYSLGKSPVLVAHQKSERVGEGTTIAEGTRPADEADFSTDGQWIAFTHQVDGNYDIYRISSSGAPVTRLTDSPGQDFHPAWKPTN